METERAGCVVPKNPRPWDMRLIQNVKSMISPGRHPFRNDARTARICRANGAAQSSFAVPESLRNQNLVLTVGKIN